MFEFNKDEYLRDLTDAESLSDDSSPESGDPGAASPLGEQSTPDDGTSSTEGAYDAQSPTDSGTAGQPSTDRSTADSQSGTDESSKSADEPGTDQLTELGKAKREAAEYLAALQRERAEFINFRNRSLREQERAREHGIIDVLTAELPALDDIDRIREHGQLDVSTKAVADKIDKAFAKFGVEKFGQVGEVFDPTKHEAVLRKPDPNSTEETVDAVVDAGYRIGDRVIRAARVVVCLPQQ